MKLLKEKQLNSMNSAASLLKVSLHIMTSSFNASISLEILDKVLIRGENRSTSAASGESLMSSFFCLPIDKFLAFKASEISHNLKLAPYRLPISNVKTEKL